MAVVSKPGRGLSGFGFAAVLSWLALVEGQGYFGGDQSVCGADNDFRYLGCFLGDLTGSGSTYFYPPGQYVPGNDPSLAYPGFDPGSNFDNTKTPYGCQIACRGHNFPFAAMNNGACYCGLTAPTVGAGTDCNQECTADADQTCGGVDTDVYVDPSYADPTDIAAAVSGNTLKNYYEYLGCYNFIGFNTQNTGVAKSCQVDVSTCHEYCAAQGYPFAAAIWNDDTVNSGDCPYVHTIKTQGFANLSQPLHRCRL